MSDQGVVCRLPFGWNYVQGFSEPDLEHAPPPAGTPAMKSVPPPELKAVNKPPTQLLPPGQGGVSVRGPRPSINACIVFAFDASSSVIGPQEKSARERLGDDASTRSLTADEMRENQFSTQLIAVARALKDPIVQGYALAGPGGGIAVMPLQIGNGVEAFFSPDQRPVPTCEGWVVLDSVQKMNAYADRLLDLRRTLGGATHIAAAVKVARYALEQCPGDAQRAHVNVFVQEGDNTDSKPERQVAQAALEGVETNLAGVDLSNEQPIDHRVYTPYYKGIVGLEGRTGWLTKPDDYVEYLRKQLAPAL